MNQHPNIRATLSVKGRKNNHFHLLSISQTSRTRYLKYVIFFNYYKGSVKWGFVSPFLQSRKLRVRVGQG